MKRLFKIFIFTHFFVFQLWANISVNAPKSFIENTPYLFSIQINAENANFPNIEKIDGFVVEQARTSRSMSNINGVITSKLTRQYRLYPTKDITVPSFKIEIEGKVYTTNPVKVSKKNLKKTQSSYFEFTVTPSKKELFVGESATIKLKFKYRKDVKVLETGLNTPKFENFWSKLLDNSKKYEEKNFIVQELTYLIFPQKSGQLRVEPLSIDLSILDLNTNIYTFFGNNTKSMRINSNEIIFEVKPLPEELSLIGEFSIKTSVDKQTIKEGESLNYKVEITGVGNIDDIEDIKLNIPNITLYENKPEIKSYLQNNLYQGSYKKSFSLLPTENLVIPKIGIRYFDKKTKSVKEIFSDEHSINVIKQIKQEVKLEKQIQQPVVEEKVVIQRSVEDRVTFFLMGVLLSILSIGLYFYVINKRDKKNSNELPLIKQVNKSKNSNELIKILLSYIDYNDEIKHLIFDLEKSDSQSFKELKKEAKSLIKKYNLKV